jgi:hypothetical protein
MRGYEAPDFSPGMFNRKTLVIKIAFFYHAVV